MFLTKLVNIPEIGPKEIVAIKTGSSLISIFRNDGKKGKLKPINNSTKDREAKTAIFTITLVLELTTINRKYPLCFLLHYNTQNEILQEKYI
jgi:hypothetical protein